MKKPLVAVVLAGGVGKRFSPITTNKILFPFFGKPFVTKTVVESLPAGIDKVVVVTNAENQQAIQSIQFPAPTVTVLQRAPRGMADALLSAKEEIQNSSLLIIIADDFVDPAVFSGVIEKAKQTSAFAVLPGWKSVLHFPGGYFSVESDRIKGIVEKPQKGEEPSPYVSVSGHFIADSNSLLQELEKTSSETDDVYERALGTLMRHQDVYLYPFDGPFSSLKYSWNVLDCMDQMLAGLSAKKGKDVLIKQNVVIEGEVVFGNNVKVFENTKIIGPTYIGDNTIIGNNNIIRASHIGSGCVSGFSTDIARSYIGDNCWFHNNYIGDSVLESNISLGSGAVLANLRLDEDVISSFVHDGKLDTQRRKLGAIIANGTRIGVNASIMPGVKVGSDSFVGSGVVLDKDLPKGSFCIAKQGYIVVQNQKSIVGSRDEFKKAI